MFYWSCSINTIRSMLLYINGFRKKCNLKTILVNVSSILKKNYCILTGYSILQSYINLMIVLFSSLWLKSLCLLIPILTVRRTLKAPYFNFSLYFCHIFFIYPYAIIVCMTNYVFCFWLMGALLLWISPVSLIILLAWSLLCLI